MAERLPSSLEDDKAALMELEETMSGGFRNGDCVVYSGFTYVITALQSNGPVGSPAQVRLESPSASSSPKRFWVDVVEVLKRTA